MKFKIGQTTVAFSSGMFMISTKIGDNQIDIDIIAAEHRTEGTMLVKIIVDDNRLEFEI